MYPANLHDMGFRKGFCLIECLRFFPLYLILIVCFHDIYGFSGHIGIGLLYPGKGNEKNK